MRREAAAQCAQPCVSHSTARLGLACEPGPRRRVVELQAAARTWVRWHVLGTKHRARDLTHVPPAVHDADCRQSSVHAYRSKVMQGKGIRGTKAVTMVLSAAERLWHMLWSAPDQTG